MKLQSPGDCLEGLWKRVPRYIRLTFFSSVILGVATHMYVFTNKFANLDDLDQMLFTDPGYGTASGRWLLPLFLHLDGEFSDPWLIGILSVLCLAGLACITVSLFRIRRPPACILASAVIMTFPTVASTFAYMFTATPYFLSLLLAALGTYAAVNWGWKGSILGAVAVTLSLGVYQSYFPVAAVLMVGALLFEVLDGEHTFRELLLKGVRLAATLAAALAAYLILVRITTMNIELTDYHGISGMGALSLRDIPYLTAVSYKRCLSFFLANDLGWHFGFLYLAFAASFLCCVVLGVLLLRKRRLDVPRIVLAAVLVLVYPLAGSLIYVMVAGSYVHAVMIYGLAYMLLLPLAFAEYAEPDLKAAVSGFPVQAAASWIIFLTVALASYSYAVTGNNAYLKADLSIRQCTAYSNRLLERVETCEGYEPGMDLMLLGSGETGDGEGLFPTPELDSVLVTGIMDLSEQRTSWTYDRFLKYFMGYTGTVYTSFHGRKAQTFLELEQVRDMPVYPREGSVLVVNGTVVVKLSE